MNTLLLASSAAEEIAMPVFFGGMILVALFGILAGIITSVHRDRVREQSRREIAAYIAEGSMSAEDGAKLMDSGKRRGENFKQK